MGIISRRLARLEGRVRVSPTEHERVVGREVLSRMTDEELDAYEAAVGREADEDRAIEARVEALYEEVRGELIA